MKPMQCEGCALQEAKRISPLSPPSATIMLVGDYPAANYSRTTPFQDRAGVSIETAIKKLESAYVQEGAYARWKKISTYITYAVQCCADKDPAKEVLDRCRCYLAEAIVSRRPKVVVTFGAMATKSILKRVVKFDDVRGTFVEATEGDFTYYVFPTYGAKAVLAQPGLFEEVYRDLQRAYLFAEGRETFLRYPEEELRSKYRFPRTVAEVREVCQEIIRYSNPPEADPNLHAITVDTETSSLEMYDPEAKMIMISFAWDAQKATAIVLDHPKGWWSPDEIEEVKNCVKQVLACPKPKVFHNAKFDLQVLKHAYGWHVENVLWDTLGAEHLLEEDKKGVYGLKILTRTRFPRYAGYEDKVADLREEHGGLTRGEELKRIQKALEKYEDALKDHDIRLQIWTTQDAVYQQELAVWEEKRRIEKETAKLEKRKTNYTLNVGKKPRRPSKPRCPEKPQPRPPFDYSMIPLTDLEFYAAVDADVTRLLMILQNQRFYSEIREDKRLRQYAHNVDKNLVPTRTLINNHVIPTSYSLADMEFTGVPVDLEYLNELDTSLKAVIAETEARLYELAGGPWVINNPKEITKVLFSQGFFEKGEKVVIPLTEDIRRTNKGQISADEDTLLYVANTYGYEFPKLIVHLRKAQKARTPFLTNVRAQAQFDGRMHSQFHLTGTGTGRFSSSNENLQNIPAKVLDYNIKKIFVPPTGSTFINADAKGAEIRIFAAYSQDHALIEALLDGMDPHSFFTAKAYGYDYEDIEKARKIKKDLRTEAHALLDRMRSNFKRAVFGTLYGGQAPTIARAAGISLEEAQAIINLMFQMFPSIPEYIAATQREAIAFGCVYNKLGRKRRFPLITQGAYLNRCLRQAVNFKIQSTSSDIVVWTMNQLYPIVKNDFGGQWHLTVHDSLGFSVPDKYVSQIGDLIYEYGTKKTLEHFPWMPVPFLWDVEAGRSYGELQNINKYIEGLSPTTEKEEYGQIITDDEVRETINQYVEVAV